MALDATMLKGRVATRTRVIVLGEVVASMAVSVIENEKQVLVILNTSLHAV